MKLRSLCHPPNTLRRTSRCVIAAYTLLGAVAVAFLLKLGAVEAAVPAGSDAAVRAAVAKLPGYVRQVMKKTGVPGAAVAVVHKNKLIYAEGFGVRSTVTGALLPPRRCSRSLPCRSPLGQPQWLPQSARGT